MRLLVIMIAIRVKIWMIEKVPLDLYSFCKTAFTCMSKKQSMFIMSNCEAEYIVVVSYVCHAIWLKNLLNEFYLSQEGSISIHVYNKSAIVEKT